MTQQRYSQQWMIEKLQELAARLGRSPSQVEASTAPDIPSHTIFVKRFGSWREALEVAGIPLNPLYLGYDRATLLEHLHSIGKTLGGAPSKTDLRETGSPDPETDASHFGSWRAALAEIGLEPRTSRRYGSEEYAVVANVGGSSLLPSLHFHPPAQGLLLSGP